MSGLVIEGGGTENQGDGSSASLRDYRTDGPAVFERLVDELERVLDTLETLIIDAQT